MVRHGEVLNPNGTLYTSNLRGANATNVYYLRGDGIETLEPSFTFHGFRYVEVTGLDAKFQARCRHRRRRRLADGAHGQIRVFESAREPARRNIAWSQRDNFIEVPTDRPQRDERAGWTGDTQFFIGTAAFNADVAAFYTRWLTTLVQDSQLPSGAMANVAPKFGARLGLGRLGRRRGDPVRLYDLSRLWRHADRGAKFRCVGALPGVAGRRTKRRRTDVAHARRSSQSRRRCRPRCHSAPLLLQISPR